MFLFFFALTFLQPLYHYIITVFLFLLFYSILLDTYDGYHTIYTYSHRFHLFSYTRLRLLHYSTFTPFYFSISFLFQQWRMEIQVRIPHSHFHQVNA